MLRINEIYDRRKVVLNGKETMICV